MNADRGGHVWRTEQGLLATSINSTADRQRLGNALVENEVDAAVVLRAATRAGAAWAELFVEERPTEAVGGSGGRRGARGARGGRALGGGASGRDSRRRWRAGGRAAQ